MKRLISLIFIVAISVIGCSSLTPAPELIITNVDPPGGGGTLTVTFQNMNHVEAILTQRTCTFTDTMGSTPIVEVKSIAGYVPGEGTYDYSFTPSYPAMLTGTSVVVTFSGTDAYGYDKTFTVTAPKIWY